MNQPGENRIHPDIRAVLARFRQRIRAYVLLERYVDEKALAVHSNTDYFKTAIPEMMTSLEEPPQIAIYEEVD